MTRPLSCYQPSPDTSPMMRWSIKPLSTQSSLKPGRGGKACFACDSSCVLVSHKSCSQQARLSHPYQTNSFPPPEIAPIYRSQPSLPRPSLAPTPRQSTLTLAAHWMSHSSRRSGQVAMMAVMSVRQSLDNSLAGVPYDSPSFARKFPLLLIEVDTSMEP